MWRQTFHAHKTNSRKHEHRFVTDCEHKTTNTIRGQLGQTQFGAYDTDPCKHEQRCITDKHTTTGTRERDKCRDCRQEQNCKMRQQTSENDYRTKATSKACLCTTVRPPNTHPSTHQQRVITAKLRNVTEEVVRQQSQRG